MIEGRGRERTYFRCGLGRRHEVAVVACGLWLVYVELVVFVCVLFFLFFFKYICVFWLFCLCGMRVRVVGEARHPRAVDWSDHR